MIAPAKKKATYEDLLRLPENVTGEIIHGELYTSPCPTAKHAIILSSIGVKIGGPFQFGEGGPG